VKRKILFVLIIFLLLSFFTSSCSVRKTGDFHVPSRFADEIIYSASDGIHTVNFVGGDDKLLVSESDVLKLFDSKGEFDKVAILGKVGISSNGSKLFFSASFKKPPQGQIPEMIHSALFSIDSDGRNLKQLTPEGIDCYEVRFSPDKNIIAFVGISIQKEAIYILSMKDGNAKRVTPWYYDKSNPNGATFAGITDLIVSQDGKRIFFVAKTNQEDNYVLNMLDTKANYIKTIVKDAIGFRLEGWSPDGKTLAFTLVISNKSYPNEKLCTVKSDGSDFKEITTEFYLISSIKWSNDSSKILFHHLGKAVIKEPAFPKNDFLSIVESNGTNFKEIGGYDTVEGYWTPDGKKILAVIGEDINFALEETTGKQAIYIMDVDSMNPVRITPYYTSIDKLIFHPSDNNKIIFTTGIYPCLNTLQMLDLNERSVQTIKSFEENQDITDIVFSPDYEKYFIRVVRTTVDTAYNTEQSVSLYIYNTNTNALINEFEGNNEYLTNINWIGNQKICFIKGVTEENHGNLCILDVDSGETFELTKANTNITYGWWLAINE
jgi:Tol biopolymer transport system component